MIRIGLIQGVHGIKGEVKVLPLTDFPDRFKKEMTVALSKKEGVFAVETVRYQGNTVLLKFGRVEDRDAAQTLVGSYLEIPEEEAMPLPAGHFYHFQVIGLKVYENNVCLGVISEIIESAAHDVYVVKQEDGGQFLFPALKSIVQAVDLPAGRMEVSLPPGLLEAT